MSTWITRSTVGHFCPDTTFSSPYDCPAVCAFDAAKLADPRCAPYRSLGSCASRQPCAPGGSLASLVSTSAESIAAACTCCDLSLDQARLGEVPLLQLWIWAVPLVMLWCVWLLFLKRAQTPNAEAINSQVISAGDYAVLVTGLGTASGDNTELEEFARHYGEVVMAVHLRSVGGPLSICNEVRPAARGASRALTRRLGLTVGAQTQIRRAEIIEAELKALDEKRGVHMHGRTCLDCCCGTLDAPEHWFYKRLLCWWRSPASAFEAQSCRVKALRLKLQRAEDSGVQPLGALRAAAAKLASVAIMSETTRVQAVR